MAFAVPETVRQVIEQHRRLAEQKGTGIPINRQEAEMVETARKTQPEMPDASWLALCRSVSALALEESRARGQATATLGFTFGGDEGLFFSTRVAKLREHEEADKKRRYAEEHRASARRRGNRGESEERRRLRAESLARAGAGPGYEPLSRRPSRPKKPTHCPPVAALPEPKPSATNSFYEHLLELDESEQLATINRFVPQEHRAQTLRDLDQLKAPGDVPAPDVVPPPTPVVVPAPTPKPPPKPLSPIDAWQQLPDSERRRRLDGRSLEDKIRLLDEALRTP